MTMNHRRGFRRIALVLAVIALVPGFLLGAHVYQVKLEKPATITKPFPQRPHAAPQWRLPDEIGRSFHPMTWRGAIAGVFGSVVAFFVVFFGFRPIAGVFIWIVEGFTEDEPRYRGPDW